MRLNEATIKQGDYVKIMGRDGFYVFLKEFKMKVIRAMYTLPAIRSSIPWFALIASGVGITAIGTRSFETDEARANRAEWKRQKDLRLLADKISGYGQGVHQRYPTGDVVVSVPDLAEQLGKRPDAVAKALHLLLTEQKVQEAPLKGYWKLNL
ncbi:MAG: hypothetical protein ABSF15_24765 [Candidatus Sulfotelmatobacter sp.]|jgi:hypothetical protein